MIDKKPMDLPSVQEIKDNKIVILRMDTDVPMQNGVISDVKRLEKSLNTINCLLEKQARIIVLGHAGRPKGIDPNLSLRPVYKTVLHLYESTYGKSPSSIFLSDVFDTESVREALETNRIVFLENLRFWPGEEENDQDFLNNIASISNCYVNDALAVSHREHRSIMLFQDLPTWYGISFVEEVSKIFRVISQPEHPLVVLLGGAKADKLNYITGLQDIADTICVGGKLPKLITAIDAGKYTKTVFANLNTEGLDLSDEDIEKFTKYIRDAKMIVWIGAMGFFEKESYRRGTLAIARAISQNNAFSVVAGGDTEASIQQLHVEDTIDLVASGGGVFLELLTKGTLPAWK